MSEETTRPLIRVALIHYPVKNREGLVITTAITNLDVHDIARAARTYNISDYYVVTPIERQRMLAQRIIEHWCDGYGASKVPERGEALRLVRTAESIEEVKAEITAKDGCSPLIVATCARHGKATISFENLRRQLTHQVSTLLLFGTGWGLADQAFEWVDEVLDPITTEAGDYNHLSVRSAASIVFDRLLGRG